MLYYNDRAYDSRGWCVAEEAVAFESSYHSYLTGPLSGSRVKEAGSREKVYRISSNGCLSVPTAPAKQTTSSLQTKLQSSIFTGKGDLARVVKLYADFQLRIAKTSVALGPPGLRKEAELTFSGWLAQEARERVCTINGAGGEEWVWEGEASFHPPDHQ